MMRALIFDFDGTILDTEMPAFLGWQHIYSHHGTTLGLDEYSLAIGTDHTVFDPRKTLEERIGRELNWETVDAERRAYYYKLIEANEILPGIKKLLHEAGERGLPCAVASSSQIDWVQGHLDRLGLLKHFSFLSCAGNGQRPKPAPDVYLEALRLLQVSSGETIAIEDSPNGVRAAQAAGIPCVIVPNQITRQLSFSEGHKLTANLEDFSLDTLHHGCNL